MSNVNPYESPQQAGDAAAYAGPPSFTWRIGVPSLGLLILSVLHLALWLFILIAIGRELPSSDSGGFFCFVAFFATPLVLIALGAIQMRQLQNLNWCRAAAFLACIPIISPGFILGIPFGIWALVSLLRPSTADLFYRPVEAARAIDNQQSPNAS